MANKAIIHCRNSFILWLCFCCYCQRFTCRGDNYNYLSQSPVRTQTSQYHKVNKVIMWALVTHYWELILFHPHWAPILGKTHAKEDALGMHDLMVCPTEISHPFNLINSLFLSFMTMAVRNFLRLSFIYPSSPYWNTTSTKKMDVTIVTANSWIALAKF